MSNSSEKSAASKAVESVLETDHAKRVYDVMQRRKLLRERIGSRSASITFFVLFLGLLLMNFVRDLAVDQGVGKDVALVIGILSYTVIALVYYVAENSRRLEAAVELLTLEGPPQK